MVLRLISCEEPQSSIFFFHDGHLWLTRHKKEIQTLDIPRIYICIRIYCNLLLWAGYIGYKSIIRARDVGYSEALLGIHWEQHKILHPTLLQKRKTWAPWLAHLIGCKNVFWATWVLCHFWPWLMARAWTRGVYSPTMEVNVST